MYQGAGQGQVRNTYTYIRIHIYIVDTARGRERVPVRSTFRRCSLLIIHGIFPAGGQGQGRQGKPVFCGIKLSFK